MSADDNTHPELQAFLDLPPLDPPPVSRTPLNYDLDRQSGTVTVNGVELDESDLIQMLSDLQDGGWPS